MDALGLLVLLVQILLCYVFKCGMVIRLRQPYLRHALALPNAGTHTEDINIKDPIMDFYVRMYATNGATNNVENSIIDVLNSITLVDGSDVLWALDAEEILANQFYHYKESTDLGIDERPSVVQATTFKIPLGIGRMHPEVAFDPTRFANPQLVLDWDIANIRAVGADAFVTNTLAVDIMADVIDEAPTRPTGYLMTKEISEYTAVAATEARVELPVDYAYRTIYVRSYHDNKCPIASLNTVEHSVNEQKYRPFDIFTDDWVEWLKEWYGMWHMSAWYFLAITATEQRNPYLRANLGVSLEAMTAATDIQLDSLANCQINMTGANAAAEHIHASVQGALPFGTWAWPYGDPESPEEWLQFVYTDKSRLNILSMAGETPLVQVFLTQHRKY